MAITINGSTGIAGVDGSAGTPALQGSDTNTGISFGSDVVIANTGGVERLRLAASGQLGIGGANYGTSGQVLTSAGASAAPSWSTIASSQWTTTGSDIYYTTGRVLMGTASSSKVTRAEFYGQSSSATEQAIVRFGRGSNPGGAAEHLTTLEFAALTSGGVYATIEVLSDGTPGTNDYPGRIVLSTTADGAASPTERLRLDSSGRLLLGTTSASGFHILNRPSASEGNAVLYVGYSLYGSANFFECNSGFYSASATAIQVCKNTSTNRSINAGGTVNASGADYAEYMVKSGDFAIAKGDICGIDANGCLTNIFSEAVSSVVKSTNPSYVGGDTWGTEDILGPKPNEDEQELLAQWEANLEAERQKVDRIAFAGQVPVNVIGAVPGQYIVPVEDNGGISGIAKDEADLTLAEYMRAVGKVIAIEDDGRARIIVKVA